LGTAKNPAVVTVKTKERAKDVESVFNENGWAYSIALEPDKDEDITDLEILLNPQKRRLLKKKWGAMRPVHAVVAKNTKNAAANKGLWEKIHRSLPAGPSSCKPAFLTSGSR
jgi:hypothetical protein